MSRLQASQDPQKERVDIINGVREISNRLADIRDKIKSMRTDIMGEGESAKPSQLSMNSLDGLVSGIFPTLAEIEDDLARVMNRLGVGVASELANSKSDIPKAHRA